MLKVTQLFIDELDKREYSHRPVEQMKDGSEIVRLGFKLENAKMTVIVVFDPNGRSVGIRCFDFIQDQREPVPAGADVLQHIECEEAVGEVLY